MSVGILIVVLNANMETLTLIKVYIHGIDVFSIVVPDIGHIHKEISESIYRHDEEMHIRHAT